MTDNPPAFPSTKPIDHWGSDEAGMSLRDWFAGQALAGLCACSTMSDEARNADYAAISYGLAEAMLAERAKASP